jgi:superfamily II DNA/RNA helicase
MYGKGLLSDVDLQVLHSSLELTKLDYNSLLGSLKEDTRIDSKKYRKLFRDVLSQLIKKLKLPNKSMSTLNNVSKNAISVFGTLEKSIIFAHGIPEAKCLDKYFKELGVGVLTSHSKNLDEIPEETFTEFENNPNIKVLIAVNRGKEGFDFPDLYNVIDMTFTQNFEVVMQIVGRLMRKSKNNNKKVFYKIAPKNTAGYFVDWMDCMFMLFDDYWYQNFNGKNAYNIRIPNALLARNKNLNQQSTTSKTKKGNFKPKNLEELLPNSLSFMNKNAWFKLDDQLSTVATTSLKDIVYKFNNINHWTPDKIREEALKYNTKAEFISSNPSAYNAARNLNILDEVCSHMEAKLKYWTEEEVREEALKYNSRVEFRKNSVNAYSYAKRFGIMNEICTHMELKRKPYSINIIREEALKYNSRAQFRKNNGSAYGHILQLGISDDIFSHMDLPKNKKWTIDELKEDALKYNTKTDFRKNNGGGYVTAHRLGILDEICSHMQVKRRKWTPSELKEDALKYNTRAEWKRKGGAGFQAAKRMNILNDICSHMRPYNYKN